MTHVVVGVVLAIGITTVMDATGYTMFSALPLIALIAVFWALQRFSRAEIGLSWGNRRGILLALLYPVAVLGAVACAAWIGSSVDTSGADWQKAGLNMVLMSTTGILVVLITEEGFFRGWLWASLKRAGKSEPFILLWSSVAFAAWHVSAVSLDTGFDVPARQIPVYLVNAAMIGAVWGMLRWISGSAFVCAVSHAVWNGLDYPLFGFGTNVGALGIARTEIYGPEVGVLGLGLNLVFAVCLWRWGVRRPESV
jgi:membrane protease YdiL (CAAX protease family)